MDSVISLISALSKILWPLLGFTTLLIFRKEIAEILRRIKKGKMLGQEIELSDSLEELRAYAETVKVTTSSIQPPTLEPQAEILENIEKDEIKHILDEATRSPRVALITLGGYIELAARRALSSNAPLIPKDAFSATEALDKLNDRFGGLSGNIASSMKLFMEVRNKLVHMREASEDDIISALDSGITILRTLKALPIQTTTVLHTEVPLFSDSECKLETFGRGLILEIISPGGIKKNRIIFPTKKSWFKKGQNVSWEWDLGTVWSETWYINPETGEKTKAWLSSGEFTGQSLDHYSKPHG